MNEVNSENVEAFINEVISELLYLPSDSYDRDDSFTKIGMDSLSAIELVSRIKDKFDGVEELKGENVFDNPTVSQLSAFIVSLQKA